MDDDIDNLNDRRTATITHTATGGDYGDNNVAASLAVTVTDDDEANEAPVFTDGENATRGLPENSGANVNVGAPVAATDAESDTLAYTLSGTDAASFAIVEGSGQLQTISGVAYDFEDKSSYAVTVEVTDGKAADGGADTTIDDTITVTITLTDANDAPVFEDGDTATREVPENSGANVNVGTPVDATDADNDTLTYTLSGTDAGSFNIAQSTGQLATRSGVTYDFETKPSYSVTVEVNDGRASNNTASIAVTINLTDVVEAVTPPVASGTIPAVSVAVNATQGHGCLVRLHWHGGHLHSGFLRYRQGHRRGERLDGHGDGKQRRRRNGSDLYRHGDGRAVRQDGDMARYVDGGEQRRDMGLYPDLRRPGPQHVQF